MKKIAVFFAAMLFSVTICYAGSEVDLTKNYVIFDIDMSISNLVIDVYNSETNEYIERVFLNKNNKTYYYDKGLNIRIKEITSNSAYKWFDDITINNESVTLSFERIPRDVTVRFTTIYRGYGYYIESVYTDTDITILNSDFEVIGTCVSEGDCETVLKTGTYYIIDNKTGGTFVENIRQERLVYVARYFIIGLYSEDDLELDNVTRHGNLYYFDTPAFPTEYTINGETLDFSDSSNYYYIHYEGIFYKYSKKDEVIEDTSNEDNAPIEEDTTPCENTHDEDAFPEKEITIADELLVEVPNTEACNLDITYFKKKYYFE